LQETKRGINISFFSSTRHFEQQERTETKDTKKIKKAKLEEEEIDQEEEEEECIIFKTVSSPS
jgi:hypothetical protein